MIKRMINISCNVGLKDTYMFLHSKVKFHIRWSIVPWEFGHSQGFHALVFEFGFTKTSVVIFSGLSMASQHKKGGFAQV